MADEIAYWTAPAEPYKYVLKVTTADGQVTRPVAGPYDIRFDIPLVQHSQPAWSADGKTIAFALKRGIYTVPAAGGQATQRVAGGPTNSYVVHSPSFAPDGRQLAYVKSFDDQGAFTAWQVVVRNLQNGQERTLASGSSSPGDSSDVDLGPQSWSPDSDEVAYAEAPPPTTRVDTVKVAPERRKPHPASWSSARWPAARRGRRRPDTLKHVEVTQSISPTSTRLRSETHSRESQILPLVREERIRAPAPVDRREVDFDPGLRRRLLARRRGD